MHRLILLTAAGRCLLLGLTVGLASSLLYGAAWTQEKGHGQLILNFSFLETSHWHDQSGQLQRFADQGTFRKFEVNPYLEYGLNSKTTLIVNTLVPFMRYGNDYGAASSAGFGDTEIGVKRRLSGESRTVISGQFTAKFPVYSVTRTPPPGNHQLDLETGLSLGRGGTLAERHVFASAGSAFRRRNGAPADQFRSDASVGVDLVPRVMGLFQYFGITGLRNGTPFQTGGNPNVQSDFDLYKTQVSLVLRVQRRTRIQIGWITPVSGRNTGAGHTFLAALWREF